MLLIGTLILNRAKYARNRRTLLEITVISNPKNLGKYSLQVGSKDEFCSS